MALGSKDWDEDGPKATQPENLTQKELERRHASRSMRIMSGIVFISCCMLTIINFSLCMDVWAVLRQDKYCIFFGFIVLTLAVDMMLCGVLSLGTEVALTKKLSSTKTYLRSLTLSLLTSIAITGASIYIHIMHSPGEKVCDENDADCKEEKEYHQIIQDVVIWVCVLHILWTGLLWMLRKATYKLEQVLSTYFHDTDPYNGFQLSSHLSSSFRTNPTGPLSAPLSASLQESRASPARTYSLRV